VDALNVILALVNIAVALYQGWREWRTRRQPEPHPLEPALRDLAQAVREARS
jgi:hypothetical protein